MNEALIELIRINGGKAVQLATKIKGSAPEAVSPPDGNGKCECRELRTAFRARRPPEVCPRHLMPDLDALADGYEKCETHRQRLRLIKFAQGIATRIRYSPDRLDRGTPEWREKIARDERPAKAVASIFGIRKATVLLYRREFGVVRKPGRPKKVPAEGEPDTVP